MTVTARPPERPATDLRDPAVRESYEVRARIMKALAHPTRLFLVAELSRGPRCVCALTEMAGVSMATVSKHLSLLKNAGLVVNERRGMEIHYSLCVPCVPRFFDCVEAVLASRRSRTDRHPAG
jgi:ArsR family transcriptional regulator